MVKKATPKKTTRAKSTTAKKPAAAKEETPAAEAPAPAATENGQSQEQMAPQMNVLAQYVKDFSFENPNAPNSLRPRDKAPDINININVNPTPLSETDFEVELKLDAKATNGDELLFNVELIYAGVFRMQGIPQEALQAAVLIECPRLLFPFARQIIAEATRNGSFPPLMIDPVDFAQLFRQRMAEQQRANA
ncbi:MAG: protein-export chaperone SecB [Pseudomonadota bacterium]